MKVLTSTIPATAAPSQTAALLCACFHTAHAAGDFIFFDIETTGLSADNSMCWLIGTLVLQDDSLILTQYFADSPSDEKELMEQFLGTLSATSCLVHFNGTRFDIPFLQERAALLECDAQLAAKLTDCDSIDIFKMIKSYDSLLHLTNYKQKTIESFLNFPRTDKLDGKKLIALYKSYVLSKDTDSERLLLLHNSDDLAGLHEICAVLAYGQLYDTALKKDSVDSFKKVFENISMEFNYASDYEGNEITELILETAPVFLSQRHSTVNSRTDTARFSRINCACAFRLSMTVSSYFTKIIRIITICRSRTAPYIKALPPTWTNPDAPPQLKTPAIHGLSRTP